jgi:O-antigen/teichoic acid export membrane protein
MSLTAIKNLLEKGLFHLFGANFLSKIIVFLTSFVIVRIFDVETYGTWSYAVNIITFFILFQGLGTHTAVLQFGSKENEPAKIVSIFRYGFKINVIVNIIIVILSIIFFNLYTFPLKGANEVIIFLVIAIVFTGTMESYYSYYRSLLLNKEYSYLGLFFAIFRMISFVSLGYLFGINGLIVATIISYLATTLVAYKFDKYKSIKANSISKKFSKEFIKFSLLCSSNNLLSQSVYLLDTFIIGLVIANSSQVGIYKNATLIPFNLNIIPLTVVTFLFPYIRKQSDNTIFLKKKIISTCFYLALINLLIVLPLFIFAPFMIRILFTEKYIDAVLPFRILLVGYFIAGTFRIPFGNIIAAIHKVSVNMIITIICGILNIAFDILLVNKYGISGAAWATLSVFVCSSLLSGGYLIYYIRKN